MRPPNDQLFKKFINAFRILIIEGQVFGIVTFVYGETKFRSSKLVLFFSILRICVGLSLLGYCGYYFMIAEDVDRINKMTSMLSIFCCGAYLNAIWIGGLINREKFIEFFYKILDFDDKFERDFAGSSHEGNNKKIVRRMVLKYSSLFVYITFYVYCSSYKMQLYRILTYDMGFVVLLSNSAVVQMTVELVTMLRIRFVLLNQEINKIVNFFDNDMNTVERSKDIREKAISFGRISSLHLYLSKLIKLFNGIFGVTLLLKFGVNFSTVTIALFFTMGELQAPVINWFSVIYTFMMSSAYIIDSIFLCHACYSTVEEVKRTAELIHRIETEDHDVIDEIEMFSLQMANQEMEFSAAEFFSIDNTLIFSIIGGVTTYIIILIQLSTSLVKEGSVQRIELR